MLSVRRTGFFPATRDLLISHASRALTRARCPRRGHFLNYNPKNYGVQMTDETRNSGTKPDGRFKPGNPGKPRGVRHRATQLAEKIASADLKEIVEKVVALAKEGDSAAYTALLNRLWPPPKGRLVQFGLPPINTAADAKAAIGAVLAAVAAGKLTVDEGDKLAGIIQRKAEATHMRELSERLAALEAAGKPQTITSYRKVA
jgi:hypothetical protein